MWFAILIAALSSYLLGNLNGSVCISALMEDDVRKHGSGNAGLTNFFRNYGFAGTGLVLLVDMIGFLIMTPLLLIGLMYLFGERSFVKMLIIALITTGCIWLLFTKVFMIFLPVGRIFR